MKYTFLEDFKTEQRINKVVDKQIQELKQTLQVIYTKDILPRFVNFKYFDNIRIPINRNTDKELIVQILKAHGYLVELDYNVLIISKSFSNKCILNGRKMWFPSYNQTKEMCEDFINGNLEESFNWLINNSDIVNNWSSNCRKYIIEIDSEEFNNVKMFYQAYLHVARVLDFPEVSIKVDHAKDTVFKYTLTLFTSYIIQEEIKHKLLQELGIKF